MSNLHDKQARRQMVERYLKAETSTREEHQLVDYFSSAIEPLTEEEVHVQLLLQATTNTDTDFELSDSKVAEFDRLMASDTLVRSKRISIAGWISAVAASIAILFVLFGNKTDDNTGSSEKITAMTPSEQIDNKKIEEFSSKTNESPNHDVHVATKSANGQDERMTMGMPRSRSLKNKSATRSAATFEKEIQQNISYAHHNSLDDIMEAANITGEQVETYHIQPAGDATIVTKTFVDGTSTSCIVCAMDDGSGYSVIPL